MKISELERNLVQRVCVGDLVTRSAASHPQRLAVKDGEFQFDYRQFNEAANRCASALLALGLGHQDRVAFATRNTWEFLAAYFGCAKAGLIAVPLNPALRPGELDYCLRDSGARVLLAESLFAPGIGQIAGGLPDLQHIFWLRTAGLVPETPKTSGTFEDLLQSGHAMEIERAVGDRDAVQLLYTSGTTSAPKGVLTSHVAITVTALSTALRHKMDGYDVVLHLLPLFHCAQLNAFAVPAFAGGGTSVILSGYDPVRVAEVVEQDRVTLLLLLPMMYQALLSHPGTQGADFSSVRLAAYAMAPMPSSTMREIQMRFPNANVLLGSGQTEFTPPTTFQFPAHQHIKAASWGSATPSVQVEVMDGQGRLLPRGQTGEIVYRGPQAMEGYWKQSEKTERAFQYGWFHSGDIGHMDEEGVVWFTDRKKDMVKTGGENVPSLEVERRLLEHPAVAEAAVVGLPHGKWGEAVTGLIIVRQGMTVSAQDLAAFCREALADFKVPKRIEFVREFPRTGTGKIQKHELRKQYSDLYEREM
ncbi:MAG: long-chain-fatty-acid--CoA ligase [Bacilli bacterium]